jgi:hypothetical protein
MAKSRYRVTGEWTIVAESAEEAENLIENAVAAKTDADLEDCNAEIEDADIDSTPEEDIDLSI